MKNDSIKKYLIPNIPYLFVLWAFLKLGTAYRLAAGSDFAHKLMGRGQTIGPSFADIARKYPGKTDYLAQEIRSGGSGVGGAVPMPPQTLGEVDAKVIAVWLAACAGK